MESKEDFIEFLNVLLKDYEEDGEFWQNQDLQSFLAGMAGYAAAPGGYCQNAGVHVDPSKPTWRLFAEILCGARAFDALD
jgi:hypothetical protein